jgi:RNA polymerase sigma factor (sigma-70 family)
MQATTGTDARALVDRVRCRDDPQAWSDLVQRYQPVLRWATRQYGLSADDAADAIQITWLRCLEHLDQLTHAEQLGSWLVTICRRESIRLGTRRLREVPAADPEPAARALRRPSGDGAAEVDDRLECEQRAQLVRAALAVLPQRERRLVQILMEPDPPTYRQISERLGIPVGSIGPVRMRALNRLRTVLIARGVELSHAGLI